MEGKLASTSTTVSEALEHGRRLLAPQPRLAGEQARAILEIDPDHTGALRLLGAALRRSGDEEAARAAEARSVTVARTDRLLMEAAAALVDNELAVAEPLLRGRLKEDPFDIVAIRMMAELAARVGRPGDAEHLLRRALDLSPGFDAARANLATILYRQHRAPEALALLDELETGSEFDEAHRNLRAAALGRIGGYQEAIAIYREVLDGQPTQPKLWMSLAHLLKTVGEQDEAIAAYRRAIDLAPTMGEVWWSLANLKTVRFSDADLAAMEAALASHDLGDADKVPLRFALGKAREDRGEDMAAWNHYAAGNALRSAELGHDPARITGRVDRSIALMDAPFFAARERMGDPAPDPIFILGMPRAGSTLVEQILASHSMVEGTMELPDLLSIVGELDRDNSGLYPAMLADLDPAAIAAMGRDYIERTRIHRQTDRPFFIDKMPNNWAYAGFIRLILPNAKIVDARRHPLACGFSNFKQHYARGQAFSYDLSHFGQYYADYVRLMAHLDRVQPGRVHRVIHERLVDNPEEEVRALLAYLGLEFEDSCLRFHENKRAVRTASSEQVRRPISRDGIDQWRRFEQWLDPLKAALGPALAQWDDAPLP